jgi:hypothetical protein
MSFGIRESSRTKHSDRGIPRRWRLQRTQCNPKLPLSPTSTLKTEAQHSSETSVNIYQTTSRHMPQSIPSRILKKRQIWTDLTANTASGINIHTAFDLWLCFGAVGDSTSVSDVTRRKGENAGGREALSSPHTRCVSTLFKPHFYTNRPTEPAPWTADIPSSAW